MTTSLADLHRHLLDAQRRRAVALLVAGLAAALLATGLPWERRRTDAGEAWAELTVALPWSWPLVAAAAVAVVLVLTRAAVRAGAVVCGVAGASLTVGAVHTIGRVIARGRTTYEFELGIGSWVAFVAGLLLVVGAVSVWRLAGPERELPAPEAGAPATGVLVERRALRELRRAAARTERASAGPGPSREPSREPSHEASREGASRDVPGSTQNAP